MTPSTPQLASYELRNVAPPVPERQRAAVEAEVARTGYTGRLIERQAFATVRAADGIRRFESAIYSCRDAREPVLSGHLAACDYEALAELLEQLEDARVGGRVLEDLRSEVAYLDEDAYGAAYGDAWPA